jgi:Fatty acid hydroxylase superfamily
MTTTPTAEQTRAAAIARGRAKKRDNAITAVLCGCLPAVILEVMFPAHLERWLIAFLLGLLWANGFEYFYHRFLLHVPGNLFAHRHLLHHMSVGTPTEGEQVNLGGKPIWVALLFVVNGAPVVLLDLILRLGVVQGIFLGFVVYLLAVEEIHWRIHMEEWLPPGLRFAKAHHLAHHERADERFNVFLPLFDSLFGSMRSYIP